MAILSPKNQQLLVDGLVRRASHLPQGERRRLRQRLLFLIKRVPNSISIVALFQQAGG